MDPKKDFKLVRKYEGEQPSNYFYGVDVTNHKAVEKEYNRLKKRHTFITMMVIVLIGVLGLIFFDFYRVNSVGGKPIFAVSKKVENGRLFSGIGYKVLYCDSGERYVGSNLYYDCSGVTVDSFNTFIKSVLLDYAEENGNLDRNNLKSFEVIDAVFDEELEDSKDYFITVSFTCNSGDNCFKTGKEYYSTDKASLYVSLNVYNEVVGIKTFKETGSVYDNLVLDYTEKVKQYLITNNKFDEEHVRSFSINLMENHGKYTFRGNTYADSYLIQINYLCSDEGNLCVMPEDDVDIDGDYANFSFLQSMFLDENGEVQLIGAKEYLNL